MLFSHQLHQPFVLLYCVTLTKPSSLSVLGKLLLMQHNLAQMTTIIKLFLINHIKPELLDCVHHHLTCLLHCIASHHITSQNNQQWQLGYNKFTHWNTHIMYWDKWRQKKCKNKIKIIEIYKTKHRTQRKRELKNWIELLNEWIAQKCGRAGKSHQTGGISVIIFYYCV